MFSPSDLADPKRWHTLTLPLPAGCIGSKGQFLRGETAYIFGTRKRGSIELPHAWRGVAKKPTKLPLGGPQTFTVFGPSDGGYCGIGGSRKGDPVEWSEDGATMAVLELLDDASGAAHQGSGGGIVGDFESATDWRGNPTSRTVFCNAHGDELFRPTSMPWRRLRTIRSKVDVGLRHRCAHNRYRLPPGARL